jgi:hypothetical protein
VVTLAVLGGRNNMLREYRPHQFDLKTMRIDKKLCCWTGCAIFQRDNPDRNKRAGGGLTERTSSFGRPQKIASRKTEKIGSVRSPMSCKIWCLIFRTVSEDDAHRGNVDDCLARALAVKPAPSARRHGALGLDRSARPSKFRRPLTYTVTVMAERLSFANRAIGVLQR